MPYHFDAVPLEFRIKILQLEAKEFGDQAYHLDSEITDSTFRWIPNMGKFQKRRLHFLHLVALHMQLDTLLHMVRRDKKFNHYQLFLV